MINKAILVGRLTRDPELRYTASNAAVASFTMAVNRQFTNAQGEREADFINCVMWRKAAENFCNFTRKGSLVGIDGRIQTRSYKNQADQQVFVTEVVAENFSLLESKAQAEAHQQQAPATQANTQTKKQSNQNPNDPFANGGQSIDISDDDLPF